MKVEGRCRSLAALMTNDDVEWAKKVSKMTENITGAYCAYKTGNKISGRDRLTMFSFEEIRPLFTGVPCPYDHQTQTKEYEEYKGAELYLLFLVKDFKRPATDDRRVYTKTSNWFIIDIDKFSFETPKEKAFEILKNDSPPFVRFIQLTGKGLHIWCHSAGQMNTENSWTHTYDAAATVIWRLLDGRLKFDGRNRSVTQGAYLWRHREENNYDNPQYEDGYIVDGECLEVEELYTNKKNRDDSTQSKTGAVSTTTTTKSSEVLKPKDYFTDSLFMTDYQNMSIPQFVTTYSSRFDVITDNGTDFQYHTTYTGKEVVAFRTNSQYIKVHVPFRYCAELKRPMPTRKKDGEGRRRYLFGVASTIMRIRPSTCIEHLLFNVLYYYLHFIDNSDRQFTKKLLLDIALSAFIKYEKYRFERPDKRKWIIGENFVPCSTGYRLMNRGEKISAAQKLRKSDTINSIMEVYDLTLSVSENLPTLREQGITVSERYVYDILRSLGITPVKKPKAKRVSAYRVADGKRVSVAEDKVDGVTYVTSKQQLQHLL